MALNPKMNVRNRLNPKMNVQNRQQGGNHTPYRADGDGYVFHSTFAYRLYPLASAEASAAYAAYTEAARLILQAVGPVTLGPPELCRFRDMGEFVPVRQQAAPPAPPPPAAAAPPAGHADVMDVS